MRYPAGQSADAFEALCLTELLLQFLALGNIGHHYQGGIPPLERNRVSCDFDADNRSIAFSVTPWSIAVKRGCFLANILQQGRNILDRPDIRYGHPEKLLLGITVLSDGGVVDGQER